MIIRKMLPKFPSENNGFRMTTEFDNFKFTLVTYFCFGTFSMVLIGKIGDLQAQIRSVELEARFKSAMICLIESVHVVGFLMNAKIYSNLTKA